MPDLLRSSIQLKKKQDMISMHLKLLYNLKCNCSKCVIFLMSQWRFRRKEIPVKVIYKLHDIGKSCATQSHPFYVHCGCHLDSFDPPSRCLCHRYYITWLQTFRLRFEKAASPPRLKQTYSESSSSSSSSKQDFLIRFHLTAKRLLPIIMGRKRKMLSRIHVLILSSLAFFATSRQKQSSHKSVNLDGFSSCEGWAAMPMQGNVTKSR